MAIRKFQYLLKLFFSRLHDAISLRIGIMGTSVILLSLLSACGAKAGSSTRAEMAFLAESESAAAGDVMTEAPLVDFNADSAYRYVERQVQFGPRVPNSQAHRLAGEWLVNELKRHGFKVTEQTPSLKAFDGTVLNARNIFAQINPEVKDRILFLAHWDCRPWADQDPDPSRRSEPVDGANDGASGVGVLLEMARQLALNPIEKGVDILFVDAEDWGTDGDEDSWALGAQYFANNPPVDGYSPRMAVLLDMVGGKEAIFCREYFSELSAPQLAEEIWQTAASLGYGSMFPNRMGSAILDDHVQLIKAGIPAIDIVEYHPEDDSGFNPRWHTTSDNMDGISKATLDAVGTTLLNWLYK